MNPANSEFDAYSGDYNDRVNRALGFPGISVDFFTRVKVDYFVDFMAEHGGGRYRCRLGRWVWDRETPTHCWRLMSHDFAR